MLLVYSRAVLLSYHTYRNRWVDLVHAGSAVALAAVDRPRARAGITDGLIARAGPDSVTAT